MYKSFLRSLFIYLYTHNHTPLKASWWLCKWQGIVEFWHLTIHYRIFYSDCQLVMKKSHQEELVKIACAVKSSWISSVRDVYTLQLFFCMIFLSTPFITHVRTTYKCAMRIKNGMHWRLNVTCIECNRKCPNVDSTCTFTKKIAVIRTILLFIF